MVKKLLLILASAVFLCLIASGAYLYLFYDEVSKEAAERIDRGIIDSIIFSESPVYYDDGQNIVGVFFDKTHRKYIHYAEIPPLFIKALIATEDRDFFDHPGFNAKAIFRAAIANFRARKVTQGGSTITQQTAKNIFKREKKSYTAKLKELMQAILLERRYTKEEILEMYINQFFVTGFGRGLRIAAHYYFDKDVKDLDLVEVAFIAGSMKSPNSYNPFIKKSRPERLDAMRLSKVRKDYVLMNMLEMNFITKEQYLEGKQKPIPFNEGKVTYRLNVALDYIRDQLDSEYFKAILQDQGIENIATSGIRIYTSLNKEIQEGALRSIRTHLPLLDVKLSGYRTNVALERYNESSDESQKKGRTDLPYLCRITEVHHDKKNPHLAVTWEGGSGIIDYQGFLPVADAWLKGKTGIWASFDTRHVPDFMKLFKTGDVIAARITEAPEGLSRTRLSLSQIPELEGGIVVLKEGMIRAMVGGFFDRFFNRAVDAKRQLGSIFKPLVYTAALQLNWNNLDPLMNVHDMFRFESTFYLPRPDHKPESDQVSMTWAGVKSENLASVWLLYHLTDQLNLSEFKKLTEILGLARREDERYEQYASRIRDKYGIMVGQESLMEAAFEEAKKEIESDLIFSGHEDALDNLKRLHYSLDVEQLNLALPEEARIYQLSFSRLQSLNSGMKTRLRRLKELAAEYEKNANADTGHAISMETAFFYSVGKTSQESMIDYNTSSGRPGAFRLSDMKIDALCESLLKLDEEEVWIDRLLPSRSIDMLESHTREHFGKLAALRNYDTEVLCKLSDFKRLVNLLYITYLSQAMGISTKLDPVLSFPLGANSISILEAALTYQTMMTGEVHPIGKKLTQEMVPIITKIVDRQGNVVWEYKPKPKEVLSKRASELVTDILRLATENGTGRGARDAVRMKIDLEGSRMELPVPCFGKTGTSNKHTNSSFVGFVPGPKTGESEFGLDKGFVVASYVGYDDNRPMKGRHVVIYGASGALPLWIDTINTIVNGREYKKSLEIADLVFDFKSIQVKRDERFLLVPVSPTSGLPVSESNPHRLPRALTDADAKDNHLTLKRSFEPIEGEVE